MKKEFAEILTPEEVVEFLKIDRADFLRLMREGALPGRRIAGKWRFSKRALIDWLSSAFPGILQR